MLVQALPYIQKYAGKTVVVKYGGNAMINERSEGRRDERYRPDAARGHQCGAGARRRPGDQRHAEKDRQGEPICRRDARIRTRRPSILCRWCLPARSIKTSCSFWSTTAAGRSACAGWTASMLTAEKLDSMRRTSVMWGEITDVNTDIIIDATRQRLCANHLPQWPAGRTARCININADVAAARIAAELDAEQADSDDGCPRPAAGQGRREYPDLRGKCQRGAQSQAPGYHQRRHDPEDRLLCGGSPPRA